ncbi:MAG TPA: hypothetical protein VFS20_15755 [Longimicrobium sp.]|nr:hypothetical protein [Longimicrobium sp.]
MRIVPNPAITSAEPPPRSIAPFQVAGVRFARLAFRVWRGVQVRDGQDAQHQRRVGHLAQLRVAAKEIPEQAQPAPGRIDVGRDLLVIEGLDPHGGRELQRDVQRSVFVRAAGEGDPRARIAVDEAMQRVHEARPQRLAHLVEPVQQQQEALALHQLPAGSPPHAVAGAELRYHPFGKAPRLRRPGGQVEDDGDRVPQHVARGGLGTGAGKLQQRGRLSRARLAQDHQHAVRFVEHFADRLVGGDRLGRRAPHVQHADPRLFDGSGVHRLPQRQQTGVVDGVGEHAVYPEGHHFLPQRLQHVAVGGIFAKHLRSDVIDVARCREHMALTADLLADGWRRRGFHAHPSAMARG